MRSSSRASRCWASVRSAPTYALRRNDEQKGRWPVKRFRRSRHSAVQRSGMIASAVGREQRSGSRRMMTQKAGCHPPYQDGHWVAASAVGREQCSGSRRMMTQKAGCHPPYQDGHWVAVLVLLIVSNQKLARCGEAAIMMIAKRWSGRRDDLRLPGARPSGAFAALRLRARSLRSAFGRVRCAPPSGAFAALRLRARSLRSAFGPSLRDVRSAIHGSAVERRLLAKAPVLTFTITNNKNGPQGPDFCYWSGRRDSNPRPPAPQADALPGCATPRPVHERP